MIANILLKKEYLIGVICLMVFTLLDSCKNVYLNIYLVDMNVSMVLFFCFSVTGLFYSFITIADPNDSIKELNGNLMNVIMLNFSTLFAMFGFFYAVKYTEPAIVVSIIISTGPIANIILKKLGITNQIITKADYIVTTLISIALIYFVLIIIFDSTGLKNVKLIFKIVGIAGALTNGFALVTYTIYSKRLYACQWSVKKVMSYRYMFLIPISGIIFIKNNNMSTINYNDILIIFTVSIIGYIIPLYCGHLGVSKTDPIIVSFTLTLLPLFTLCLQFYNIGINQSVHSIVGVIFVCILSVFAIIQRYIGINSGTIKEKA